MKGRLTRQDFLKMSGAGLAGATLLGGAACVRGSGRSIMESVAVAATGTTPCRVGVEWNNYPNTQSLVPHSTCTPESLADITAIVREAESTNKRVHAFGSKWSFSDCAFTEDYVVDTRQLIQLTLDRYSHWMPSMGKHTASAMDNALEDSDIAPDKERKAT